jgi:hypothetical protein
MKYHNDYEDQKDFLERDYIFSIPGTLVPDYLSNIIRHADKVRHKIENLSDKVTDTIEIREGIMKKINSLHFSLVMLY